VSLNANYALSCVLLSTAYRRLAKKNDENSCDRRINEHIFPYTKNEQYVGVDVSPTSSVITERRNICRCETSQPDVYIRCT